jgi:hypothetical protein
MTLDRTFSLKIEQPQQPSFIGICIYLLVAEINRPINHTAKGGTNLVVMVKRRCVA